MNLDTEDKIDKIFSWYSSALMSIARRKAKWPPAKDRTKTYLYMWLTKFSKWIDENDLDDDTAEKVVLALVKYAKRHGNLNKGASILQHERIYEIALNELDEQETKEDAVFSGIQRSHAYLLDNATNPVDEYLAYRAGIGEYPTIVQLYQSGLINKNYLAISKSCRSAMSKISRNVRELLPSNRELLKINQLMTLDNARLETLKNIVGKDLLRL